MEYGAIVWDPYQKYNSAKLRGCSIDLQGSSKVGIQDTLLFLICLMCWGGCLFLKGDRRLDLYCFIKLITVWHKCPSKVSLLRCITISRDLDISSKMFQFKARHWSLKKFLQKCIIYRYYYIKRLVATSLEDITPQKNIVFMVAILNNKMASTDRDYSPFYNSVFSVMAEDRPSILFVSCTVTSLECNVTR